MFEPVPDPPPVLRRSVCSEMFATAESSLDFWVIAFNRFSRASLSFLAAESRSFLLRSSPAPKRWEAGSFWMCVRPSSRAEIRVPALTREDFAAADASCCFCGVEAWSRVVRLRRASWRFCFSSLWVSFQIVGSVIGESLDAPVRMLWRVLAFVFWVVKVEGRLRKVRHTEELRQRASSQEFMVCKYASKPLRRVSVSSGDDTVFVNQDLEGTLAGGAAPAD